MKFIIGGPPDGYFIWVMTETPGEVATIETHKSEEGKDMFVVRHALEDLIGFSTCEAAIEYAKSRIRIQRESNFAAR